MDAGRLGHLRQLIHSYVDSGRLPGAVCVVARRGQVVHVDAYGHRDVERGEPMTADTVFRIYSMTKPIASAALLTLFERGAFLLEDPVARYLPELGDLAVLVDGPAAGYRTRPAARAMTITDLLRHTSGFAAGTGESVVDDLYRRNGVADPDGDLDLAASTRRLGELPLACDPGSSWIYGISTDVVGRLCEVLSGQRLDAFLNECIFTRLRMHDTGFQVGPDSVGRFSACYQSGNGEPGYTLLDDPRASRFAAPRAYLSASQGLVSTAGDYLAFALVLAGGGILNGMRVLGPRTVQTMMLNHLPGGVDICAIGTHGGETRTPGFGFGLGGAVLVDRARAEISGTPGEFSWGGAASTAFFISPADQLVSILLTQLRPSGTYLRLRRELRAVVYSALTD
jgi:CubicO group peptidase (beta-lactamase class C family)